MVPEFTGQGLLPEGIHHTNWDGFAERFIIFQRSNRRMQIGGSIKALYDETRISGIVRRILITGSFVTEKPEPNDFDCVLVLNPAIRGCELRPAQYNLISRRMARKIFKGDVVPVLDQSEAMREYLEFFQTTREGFRMGIVEIEL